MSLIWAKLISGIMFILIPSFNLKNNMKQHPFLTNISFAIGIILLFLFFIPLLQVDNLLTKSNEGKELISIVNSENKHLAEEKKEAEKRRLLKEIAEKERLVKAMNERMHLAKEKAVAEKEKAEKKMAEKKVIKGHHAEEGANRYSISHKHGERIHRHPLPRGGTSHSHTGSKDSINIEHVKDASAAPHAVGLDQLLPTKSNGNKVDAEVNKLKSANIVFNSPSEMQKNKAYQVYLKLSARKRIEVLLDELKGTEKDSASVLYSTKMQASIIGENKQAFEITDITPSEQAISSISTTTWQWDIVPIQSGVHYFHIVLIAFIQVDGKELRFPIKTFDQKIMVNVSASDEILNFIEANWKWLLGSLIFPLVVWLWKIRYQIREDAVESKKTNITNDKL